MKKSEFIEKLKRTIRMSAARSDGGSYNSEDRLSMLAEDILETMRQNGIKPPKWMQQEPRTMADGSIRMRDVRWRFSWEQETVRAANFDGEVINPLQRPESWPDPMLDGPGEQRYDGIEVDEEEG